MLLKFIPVELKESQTKMFVGGLWRGWRDRGQFDSKHKTVATSIQITGNPFDWVSDNLSFTAPFPKPPAFSYRYGLGWLVVYLTTIFQ
jgi:hypothetical protein